MAKPEMVKVGIQLEGVRYVVSALREDERYAIAALVFLLAELVIDLDSKRVLFNRLTFPTDASYFGGALESNTIRVTEIAKDLRDRLAAELSLIEQEE